MRTKEGGAARGGQFWLKIGIEGEKEFKKALSEINQSFKVLGSEMKLVSSQFDAAMLLVDLVESYTEKDGSRLKKMIQTEYRILTARSMPSDVLKQERVIQKVLDEISDISGNIRN